MTRTAAAAGGSRTGTIAAWALYDFANSPFTTLVVTFVYATYFTQAIAADPVSGTTQWSWGVTVTALLVAALSPPLGAIADRGGYRRRLLWLFTLLCIVATAALYGIRPGQVLPALAVFVIANVSFEMAGVFYNAYLPVIAPAGRIGRVSGYGWALGYLGGLLALVVALLTLVQPDPPWFGFSTEAGENVRASNLLVALWYAVFALPLLLMPDPGVRNPQPGAAVGQGLRQLAATLREVRRYRQVARFLLARLVYNDALVTVFAFGGIYAAGTFGFSFQEILVFGIALNVTAGLGAFVMGFADDRLGGKRTVQISLWGLMAATLLATLATDSVQFWIAGIVLGIFAGPVQAASRSLLGRFTPPRMTNEFYGFFAFSGKATAFIGPLLLGLLTDWTGSQRVGVAVVLVLFVLGYMLLSWVDEDEGIARATAPQEDSIPG